MSARPSARAPKASTAAHYYAPRTAANLNGPYTTTTTAAPAAYGAYTSAQPAYGSYNTSAYYGAAYGGGGSHGYYCESSAAAPRPQSAGGYPATCAGYYPSGYPSGYATTSARYGGPRTASVYSDFVEAPQDWGGVANVALAGAGMGAAAGLLGGAAVGTTRKYWK